jgi:hypothetical protein
VESHLNSTPNRPTNLSLSITGYSSSIQWVCGSNLQKWNPVKSARCTWSCSFSPGLGIKTGWISNLQQPPSTPTIYRSHDFIEAAQFIMHSTHALRAGIGNNTSNGELLQCERKPGWWLATSETGQIRVIVPVRDRLMISMGSIHWTKVKN